MHLVSRLHPTSSFAAENLVLSTNCKTLLVAFSASLFSSCRTEACSLRLDPANVDLLHSTTKLNWLQINKNKWRCFYVIAWSLWFKVFYSIFSRCFQILSVFSIRPPFVLYYFFTRTFPSHREFAGKQHYLICRSVFFSLLVDGQLNTAYPNMYSPLWNIHLF